MNFTEIKEKLLAAGATEVQLENLDLTKVEAIFDKTQDIDGLCKNIKESFPDFDEAGFRQIVAEESKDSEATEILSDESLEEVAGGSISSWMHRNKDWVIPAAAMATIGLCYMYNKYTRYKYNKYTKEHSTNIDKVENPI